MAVRLGTSTRFPLLLLLASMVGLFGPTLVPELAHARVCDGSTNDRLVEMKKGLEDYKKDPLAFHAAAVEFELYVGKNCDSPVKKYVAGSDYAKLKSNAYQEAAKASARKAVAFESYRQADDQNVARLDELNANISDFAVFAGTTRESILRDAQVSEKALATTLEEAYKADLRKLVDRLEDSGRILEMKEKNPEEYAKNYKKLLGSKNSPSRLIARFVEAKEHLGTAGIPEDLKKRVAALDEARLTKIYAMESCQITNPKPDFPNCADSLARKMMKQSDSEIARIVKAANDSSKYHHQGERKLMEVQSGGSGAGKGTR